MNTNIKYDEENNVVQSSCTCKQKGNNRQLSLFASVFISSIIRKDITPEFEPLDAGWITDNPEGSEVLISKYPTLTYEAEKRRIESIYKPEFEEVLRCGECYFYDDDHSFEKVKDSVLEDIDRSISHHMFCTQEASIIKDSKVWRSMENNVWADNFVLASDFVKELPADLKFNGYIESFFVSFEPRYCTQIAVVEDQYKDLVRWISFKAKTKNGCLSLIHNFCLNEPDRLTKIYA